MAAPEQEKPPSQWVALTDWAKTIITLGSGLLAFTVTFLTPFVGRSTHAAYWTLAASWFLLFGVVFCGVLSYMFAIAYLRSGRGSKAAVFWANAALGVALAATIGLLAFGLQSISVRTWDGDMAVEEAVKRAPTILQRKDETFQLESLAFSAESGTFDLVIVETKRKRSSCLSVDPKRQDVSSAKLK